MLLLRATLNEAEDCATLFGRSIVLCGLLISTLHAEVNLYVSTNGTPSGPGTMAKPYDLTTALAGRTARPGTTFWIRGGNYVIGHIDTKIEGTIEQPITFRQMLGEQVRIDGSVTFYQSLGHVIIRDLELYSSDTNRLSSEIGAGFLPTDIEIIPGIASYVPDMSFINLVVHDQTRHGIYLGENAARNLVYGCVVYNNGWRSPDNAEGHSFYIQGNKATREITDNLAFNSSGANFHVYENAPDIRLEGITLDGNVAFNAGALQAVRAYRDWIIGIDTPAASADRIVMKNNMGYLSPFSEAYDDVQIGREGINGSLALLNNYLPLALWMNNWTIAAISGNTFAGRASGFVVNLNQTHTSLAAAWDGNTYFSPPLARSFLRNSFEQGFPDWQNSTGYDRNSSYISGRPTGTKVFVRPNRFEPGRANIVVYNWDNWDTISVDVSAVLTKGESYEVRNAVDYFAAPVASGVFDGEPIELPMTLLTVAPPNGPLLTPPPTGPTFNVFVLLPRLVRLETSTVGGHAQFSWPTNVGHWILQSTSSLEINAAWSAETNSPAVIGDQNVQAVTLSDGAQFFRLQASP